MSNPSNIMIDVNLEQYNDFVVHAINEDRISRHILDTFSVPGASHLKRILDILQYYRIYSGTSIDKKLTLAQKEKQEAVNPFSKLIIRNLFPRKFERFFTKNVLGN